MKRPQTSSKNVTLDEQLHIMSEYHKQLLQSLAIDLPRLSPKRVEKRLCEIGSVEERLALLCRAKATAETPRRRVYPIGFTGEMKKSPVEDLPEYGPFISDYPDYYEDEDEDSEDDEDEDSEDDEDEEGEEWY